MGALSIRLVGALCGFCDGFFCRAESICRDAHPVPERFPGSTTQLRTATRTLVGYARENLLHERIWSHLVVIFSAVKTGFFGQFKPTGADRGDCGPCGSIDVAPHGSRHLKRGNRRRARTNRTDNNSNPIW